MNCRSCPQNLNCYDLVSPLFSVPETIVTSTASCLLVPQLRYVSCASAAAYSVKTRAYIRLHYLAALYCIERNKVTAAFYSQLEVDV